MRYSRTNGRALWNMSSTVTHRELDGYTQLARLCDRESLLAMCCVTGASCARNGDEIKRTVVLKVGTVTSVSSVRTARIVTVRRVRIIRIITAVTSVTVMIARDLPKVYTSPLMSNYNVLVGSTLFPLVIRSLVKSMNI
jgi:hypothetical protein